jgi:hypothetical protein
MIFFGSGRKLLLRKTNSPWILMQKIFVIDQIFFWGSEKGGKMLVVINLI